MFLDLIQFRKLIKTVNMIYMTQKAIFLCFLMKEKIHRHCKLVHLNKFFSVHVWNVWYWSSYFYVFLNNYFSVPSWCFRFQCLLYDMCYLEDIFVGETKKFICRLTMRTFFSCELNSLRSVDWFFWITRTRYLNDELLTCSWVRHLGPFLFSLFFLYLPLLEKERRLYSIHTL